MADPLGKINWLQVIAAFIAGVVLHAVVMSLVNTVRGHAQTALG
jgi:hypothetical protein